ncbi:uncharacterized protein BDW47DRAFT_98022 [Aspergillus candidus]|uniref:Uncharacterized protein n=1 Tax=Aspergillus candidus TaxID=41067 RepID=A0A2I2FNI2_ASPCN|nr:hypothetical protein BDW47DRAFT_98022 [Aspergillus candidus]PLB42191.1 hypothetical protein BDW47DRAFT_98022 [Aspergillus candidus]
MTAPMLIYASSLTIDIRSSQKRALKYSPKAARHTLGTLWELTALALCVVEIASAADELGLFAYQPPGRTVTAKILLHSACSAGTISACI